MSNAPGDTIVLEAYFYDSEGGLPVVVTDPSLTVLAPNGITTVLGPVTSGIVPLGPGHFQYSWASSALLNVGVYTAIWTGIDPDDNGVIASETIALSEALTSWVTSDEVFDYTRATVTDDQVMQAQAMVDLFSGLPYSASASVSGRDRYWLKLAVAYQAAWMPRQPDLNGRLDMTSMTQDGNVASFTQDALVLAPAAKRALKKVSWLKSRSLSVKSAFLDGNGYASANPLSEANDSRHRWYSMGA